jgi:hypothetical protein
VFPEAPVRQFVLTFPFPLRFLFAAQPDALTQVLAVVQRGISTFLIHHAGLRVSAGPHAGRKALTLYSVPPMEERSNIPLLAKLAVLFTARRHRL